MQGMDTLLVQDPSTGRVDLGAPWRDVIVHMECPSGVDSAPPNPAWPCTAAAAAAAAVAAAAAAAAGDAPSVLLVTLSVSCKARALLLLAQVMVSSSART